jgi:hypothetical protein
MKVWDELPESEQVPRRIPAHSRIDKSELLKMTARDLYDRMRCLEDPYPNAYIEDETGKLYFKLVLFKENS